MRVVIRADASIEIGTGHIMRCLTLAEELKSKDVEVYFICRDLAGNLADYVESKGYDVFLLPKVSDQLYLESKNNEYEAYDEWLGVSSDRDAKDTHEVLLRIGNIDWLVVDHYSIAVHWEREQKDAVKKILVIDDLADRVHECDMLLDQNYYDGMEHRYDELVSESCKLLIGPQYSLLRKEFREARTNLRKSYTDIRKIFVFFGGVDATNMTSRVLESIGKLNKNDVTAEVVIGSTNPYKQQIENICAKNKNMVLHVQVENIAEMMAEADLSIGSGGTVSWERCCVGLPTMAFSVATNQEKLLRDSAKAGLIYVPDVQDPDPDEILCHLKSLMQNTLLCEHMSRAGLDLIDGKGAVRLVSAMIRPEVELRMAELIDARRIYEWRNDPGVRKYSHDTAEIDYSQHQIWFENVLKDDRRPILIGCMKDEEIGVVRFDMNNEEAEVSVYLAPKMQGRGYGAALIDAAEHWLSINCPEVKKIIAEVLPENRASKKLFEVCGYSLNTLQYQKSVSRCQ